MSCESDIVPFKTVSETAVFGSRLNNAIKQVQDYLAMGYDCALIKEAIYDSYFPGQLNGFALRTGQVFNRPTLGDLIYDMPFVESPVIGIGPQYGFSLVVKVAQNGAFVDYGNLSVGYFGGMPYCNTEISTSPVVDMAGHVEDNITGSWPVVIGENGVEGIQLYLSGYVGNAKPYGGFSGGMDCGFSTVFFRDSITNNNFWPQGQAMPELRPFSYDVANGGPDVAQALWCCISEGYNCCGTPAVGGGGSFLIPRPPPSDLEIGEENISTPVLEKGIYLSNYTFQFTNNYGRVRKL